MKVNLKIKEDNSVSTEQHEIDEANLKQVTNAIKVIKDIIQIAQDNEQIQALIQEIFAIAQQNKDKEITEVGMMILKRLSGATDVLLVEIPDQMFKLLSTMSGIDHEVLMQQKPEDAFDIYDAVIQENDIEKLVKRAKKSLALTKSQVKVMNLFPKKEQTEQKQAQ